MQVGETTKSPNPMIKEIIPQFGWNRTLKLSNEHIELIVTLDVGPRIISLKTKSGRNVFKTFDDEMGSVGESAWKIRGGHRFWIAPEDLTRTYHIDNDPIEFTENPETGEIVIESLQVSGGRILKTLGIKLDPESGRVIVRHTAKNMDSQSLEFATWALSVMSPGGIQIIPQPPLGEHPRDLLPNRTMVLWPYTDLSDERWRIGRDFITLQQKASCLPTKLGLAHKEKWVAYALEDSVFIKAFDYVPSGVYPDGGCNFETFTNGDMLEIESLGTLKTIQPGEEVSHTETWTLLPMDTMVLTESDPFLSSSITPYLKKAGLLL
jgi:hypothetical protein